jgi:hypothetical protein
MPELPVPLERYALERLTFGRFTHPVYSRGSGPPVIVMHELPGITQGAVTFAERLVERGFTVYLPSLVGSPRRRASGVVPMLRIAQICISGEFRKLAIGATSPVVEWLRGLARRLSGDAHAPVGAVGLCLTGGFALAMAVDPWITASVVAEPALPVPWGEKRQADLGLSPEHRQAILARQDLRVFGTRFSQDRISPCARFDRLGRELGPRFIRREIKSGTESTNGIGKNAHSVLTFDMSKLPASDAGRLEVEGVIEEAIRYLESRLGPAAPPTGDA